MARTNGAKRKRKCPCLTSPWLNLGESRPTKQFIYIQKMACIWPIFGQVHLDIAKADTMLPLPFKSLSQPNGISVSIYISS